MNGNEEVRVTEKVERERDKESKKERNGLVWLRIGTGGELL
jgi:hypothetical protein